MKNPPLVSSLEFLDSINYENTVEHSLMRAHKIHKLVLYQALFCLFFELAKNEEGPELDFLDSLKIYKKHGREVHSHVFTSWQQACLLEKSTGFDSINNWVLVF